MKHTPGPWEAIIPEQEHWYKGSNLTEYTVYTKKTRGELNEEGHNYRPDEARVDNIKIASAYQYDVPLSELQANAKIIASAPELLEALKPFVKAFKNINPDTTSDKAEFCAVNQLTGKPMTYRDLRKAYEAYAKATGNSND